MVATSGHWYFDFGPFTIDQKRGRLHLELAPAADRCYTTLGRHVVTERVEIPPTSSGELGSSTVLFCNWPRLSRDFTSYRAAATSSEHASAHWLLRNPHEDLYL
jgi:hypothetical protein